MNTTAVYTRKAQQYAAYRWDYSSQAVEYIYEQTGLNANAVVADIGAGTGILTRHFAGRAGKLYAVEPNEPMRQQAEVQLADITECIVVDAPAEATTLSDHSVDLITAAHAVHWFQADAAREEFRRILKPGGWLALLRNTSPSDAISDALQAVSTNEFGVTPGHPAPSIHIPEDYYFEGGSVQTAVFPFVMEQTLEQFIGATLSISFMPDETNPHYERFLLVLRDIFHTHCPTGIREIAGKTHLKLGQMQLMLGAQDG